jgi:hypothetical protein
LEIGKWEDKTLTQKLWNKKPRIEAKSDVSPFVTHNESASAGLLIPGEVRGQRNFEPLVVMLYGRRGAGKTATMTALGAWFQQQYQKSGTPVHIAANYKVDFARYCSPYLIDELGDFPEWGERLVVLIDEISAYTASERSTSRATLDIGVFLTQVRKRDVEIIFCTQFPQEISRRVLRQVDIFIEVEQTADNKDSLLYCHDYWGQWTGGWSRKPWPPTKEEADWKIRVYGVNAIWNRYDTKEVIAPVWSDQREQIIGQHWSDVLSEVESDEISTLPEQTGPPTHELEEHLRLQEARRNDATAPFVFVDRELTQAKRYFPEMNTKTFSEWLTSYGWIINRQSKAKGGTRAYPPED